MHIVSLSWLPSCVQAIFYFVVSGLSNCLDRVQQTIRGSLFGWGFAASPPISGVPMSQRLPNPANEKLNM